jgi:hypothetical protein
MERKSCGELRGRERATNPATSQEAPTSFASPFCSRSNHTKSHCGVEKGSINDWRRRRPGPRLSEAGGWLRYY